MSRERNYGFTWNNYPTNWEELIDEFYHKTKAKYIVAGKEIGANGTPHIQGHVDLKDAKTISALQKIFQPKIQLSVTKLLSDTHVTNSRNYCFKDGDYRTWGAPPRQGARTDLLNYMQSIRETPSTPLITLMEEHCTVMAQYPRFAQMYRLMKMKHDIIQGPLEHEWHVGPPGCGKSRKYQEMEGVFTKMTNKWWDGYDNEKVVLFEDWDPTNHYLGHHLKIWADRYPFMAETKGFTVKIRPQKIVITSNYSIEECFPNQPMIGQALLRRFNVIRHDKK